MYASGRARVDLCVCVRARVCMDMYVLGSDYAHATASLAEWFKGSLSRAGSITVFSTGIFPGRVIPVT